MIALETFEKLARQYHTSVFPNVVREYVQHVFLAELNRLPEAEKLLFKGGTALRIVYGSPRFSEDLDFSLAGISPKLVQSFVEGVFVKILTQIEQIGIAVEIGAKSHVTSGGYVGFAQFSVADFRPVGVEINVSARGTKSAHAEVDSIASDFVPTYSVIHLPQKELVDEKIFGALRERKKPRDFYDLYYMMRKNMLTTDQKNRLASLKSDILFDAKKVNFRRELAAFLPADQHAIIRTFVHSLEAEMLRQLG